MQDQHSELMAMKGEQELQCKTRVRETPLEGSLVAVVEQEKGNGVVIDWKLMKTICSNSSAGKAPGLITYGNMVWACWAG